MKLLLGLLLMIAASVVHSQSSCPEPEELGCLVCGEGRCISEENATAIFSFEGFGGGSCADIQAAGLIGTADNIDLACQFLPQLQSFQETCGCECREASCRPPTAQRTTLPFPEPETPPPVTKAPLYVVPETPAPTTAGRTPVQIPSAAPVATPSDAPVSEAPVAPTSNAFQASRSSVAMVFGAFVVAAFY